MTTPLIGAAAVQDIPASPIPAAAKPTIKIVRTRTSPWSRSSRCFGSHGGKAPRALLVGRLTDAFDEEFRGLKLTVRFITKLANLSKWSANPSSRFGVAIGRIHLLLGNNPYNNPCPT
jgi:hypothetical protein